MHAGLYGRRRVFQLFFIGIVALIALFAVAKAYAFTRRVGPRYRFAMLGILYLAAFVTIRAASFHHIDIILGTRLENVKVNTFLELGGTLSVAFGALLVVWRERTVRAVGLRRWPTSGDVANLRSPDPGRLVLLFSAQRRVLSRGLPALLEERKNSSAILGEHDVFTRRIGDEAQ